MKGQVSMPIYETMLTLYGDQALAHRRAGWFFGLVLRVGSSG
jgi:hypothetical protein